MGEKNDAGRPDDLIELADGTVYDHGRPLIKEADQEYVARLTAAERDRYYDWQEGIGPYEARPPIPDALQKWLRTNLKINSTPSSRARRR